MGGHADHEKIEKRIESLKSEIKQTEEMPECKKLQRRITRLASGVAVIKVGAATEVEMIEKNTELKMHLKRLNLLNLKVSSSAEAPLCCIVLVSKLKISQKTRK